MVATAATISLPVEVFGGAGTMVEVQTSLPAGSGRQIRALWMQIHGLGFADMASVRVNHSEWVALNNHSVEIAEPAKSYGGIGGGFATLKMTMPLAERTVQDGQNTVEFRFNHTDGLVSGFRVLSFNFLNAEGRRVLPPETFVQDDPSSWAAPLPDASDAAKGKTLWSSGQLVANGLPGAAGIRAHCADCHAQDGRDLKYFCYSNASVIGRARFHGLSELEGRQIASYIRSLPYASPGRPWNPPYQPGPGFDKLAVQDQAAGAGLSWVLENDLDTLPFLFHSTPTPADFRPDENLKAANVPLAMQLPDWNHWLPRVHPMDAWGDHFDSSDFAHIYEQGNSSKGAAFFDQWLKARSKFLTPHLSAESDKWTPSLGNAFYSAQLCQLVKTWELTQRSGSSWLNVIPEQTAPSEVHIPDGDSGMGGSALTNEYYSNAWYQVQLVLNSGGHRHHGRGPIDWVYLLGRIRDLQRQSNTPEAGRLLVMLIKAMQSADPATGPTNILEGWRPDQNVDPRIMISKQWAPVFQSLPEQTKRQITESLLAAWLDKTLQYPVAGYYQRGLQADSYVLPAEFKDISGGHVWEAAPEFQAAGVNAEVVYRLRSWGRANLSLKQLFHY